LISLVFFSAKRSDIYSPLSHLFSSLHLLPFLSHRTSTEYFKKRLQPIHTASFSIKSKTTHKMPALSILAFIGAVSTVAARVIPTMPTHSVKFNFNYSLTAGNFTAVAGHHPHRTHITPSITFDFSGFPTNFGHGPVVPNSGFNHNTTLKAPTTPSVAFDHSGFPGELFSLF